jgi:hypothetical protein
MEEGEVYPHSFLTLLLHSRGNNLYIPAALPAEKEPMVPIK